VDKAFSDLGKIDVVVNNAGYGLFGAAEALTDKQITHRIDTNLIGSLQVVRAALRHLRAQGGRVIQISTYGCQAALPGGSLYHASKWSRWHQAEGGRLSSEVANWSLSGPAMRQSAFATADLIIVVYEGGAKGMVAAIAARTRTRIRSKLSRNKARSLFTIWYREDGAALVRFNGKTEARGIGPKKKNDRVDAANIADYLRCKFLAE
jgi:hypothetical protein